MGRNKHDTNDTHATEQHRESTPFEQGTSTNSAHRQESSPDPRRRALIVGLATTPVLLSLMSRSALAQNVDCSVLASVILGGSVDGLPNGFDHKNPEFSQNYYATHCVEGGANGTGNATGNSGRSGNSSH